MHVVMMRVTFPFNEVKRMKKHGNNDICRAKKIAQQLIDTANLNERGCESNTCLLVYSILRDCGYQIIKIVGEKDCSQNEC
jgi:hypothetical protein